MGDIKRRKAPKPKDFQYDYPNIGYDRPKQRIASEKWIEEAELHIKKLEHHRDSTCGLWATDLPNKIPKDIKKMFFEIKDY